MLFFDRKRKKIARLYIFFEDPVRKRKFTGERIPQARRGNLRQSDIAREETFQYKKQLTIPSAARWSGVHDRSPAALRIGAARLLFLLLRRSRRRWNARP